MKFFLKVRKIVYNLIVGCVVLIILLALPLVCSIIYNEVYLLYSKTQTYRYSHPPDSRLLQRLSFIDNFAGVGNQCGYIVAEVRTTALRPDKIRAFYAPILTDISYANGPPFHEVNFYNLNDENDIEPIKRLSWENYERITRFAKKYTRTYLLLTSQTGYPPNFDPRCH